MFKYSIISLVFAAAAPALAQKPAVPLTNGASVGIYENPVQGQPPAQQFSDETACFQQADSASDNYAEVKTGYADCLRNRGYAVPTEPAPSP